MVYKAANRTVFIVEPHRAPRVVLRHIGSNLPLHSIPKTNQFGYPHWISIQSYPPLSVKAKVCVPTARGVESNGSSRTESIGPSSQVFLLAYTRTRTWHGFPACSWSFWTRLTSTQPNSRAHHRKRLIGRPARRDAL